MTFDTLSDMKKATKYFAYIRKSLEDKKRQVLSLPAQATQAEKIAKANKLHIYETIDESMTAKLPGRPRFSAMLDRIERGEASGIICWDIDRLYRNPVDEGRVRWLLQNGVITAIHTPSRTYLPQDAGLLMAVEGGRAIEHNLTFARNLKRTHEEKLRNGQWPGPRCFGFSFDHRAKTYVTNPQEAKVILTIYEEFAAGRLGLESSGRRLFELGVASKQGTPFSKSRMHKLLSNRRYMGVMVWKGEIHEGKYPVIVPADLFDKVQRMLKVKSKPRKVRKGHNFPFCGLFRCSCGAMISAQWARGHGGLYRYYRCSRKSNRPCSEPYVREESVVAQALERLRPLALAPGEAVQLRAALEAAVEREQASFDQALRKTDETLEPLEGKLRKLIRHLIGGIIEEDDYLVAKEELVVEKTRLKQERQRLQRSRESMWIEPARRLVDTLETLGKTETLENLPEISGIVQKVGTNRLISRKTVTFSFSEDYDFIPSLLASSRIGTPES